MGNLGWIRKDFTITEAQKELLHELLQKAKLSGSHDSTWNDIIEKLTEEPPQLAKLRLERNYNLVEHAAFWNNLPAIRRLVCQFKIDKFSGGKEVAQMRKHKDIIQYFGEGKYDDSQEYHDDIRDYT